MRLTATWSHTGPPPDTPSLERLLALDVEGPAHHVRVIDGARDLDAVALDELSARLAGALANLGVRPGDAVAWQSPNRWEVVALYRACWRLGAIAAPVHHQGGARDLDHVVSTVEPTMVVDPDDVMALVDGAPALDRRTDVDLGELAVVLHTSGSSGVPKGVLHTHGSLSYKANLMRSVHGLLPGDTILMPAPLAHISGLQNAITLAGAAGLTTVLMGRWDPDRALDLIEAHAVTFMVGPPTFFVSLRHAAGFSPDRVRTLRLVSSGGAGVTPAFVAEIEEQFGAVVKRTYGSTEAPTVTTSHASDDPERARMTDGRATGTVELRLGPGDEVWVRGPELFVGYTDRQATAEAVDGDWFRTGDVGRLDDEGWLTIVGRIKDLIIRGGENISAAEVEAQLEAHPVVRQAVAVAEPDERLGERVCAFVTVGPGRAFDVQTAAAWFADRGVARFKTPERIVVLDTLPVLAAGKIDRAELRRRAADLPPA
jgi:acyl-CoA synthetase (AMP-forming)/AMP-acid ligase II